MPTGRRTTARGAAQLRKAKNEKLQKLGQEVKDNHAEQVKEQMETFKKNLEGFAAKHKNKIAKDPEFRAQFSSMCRSIGVDPLQSKKGFWASLGLGLGDFYHELGIQCIRVCLQTQSQNGGLMEIDELCRDLGKIRGSKCRWSNLSLQEQRDDAVSAIGTLTPLGNGFKIVKIGSKTLVQSIPTELSTDHMALLQRMEGTGHVTASEARTTLSWSAERTEAALEMLLEKGLVWIDDQAATGVRTYWSHCLSAVDADL